MAIKIEFDNAYNPIPPVIALATKSGKRLGALPANSIIIKDCMNNAAEVSFSVNKSDFVRSHTEDLWDQIVDFKTIWVKEWNSFFEIKARLNDSSKVEKTISATSLGQAELSQINVYKEEINSADDIARDDYIPSVLYNNDNPEASIMHRLLRKAPHYRIGHVDEHIASIQRTFSFDKKSIKDCFDEVAEELNCLFVYNCYLDEDGKMIREVSAYDLEDYCPDCGKRGTFQNGCTECGGTNVIRGYGKDTSIFVSSRNLADDITLENDTGSVKNCFKLQAGDDLMTATVAGCNPDGSGYIWYISDSQKAEMSKALADKLDEYDGLYDYYQDRYQFALPEQVVSEYNLIVDKYTAYSEQIQRLPEVMCGYPALMSGYYNTIDLAMFLKHSLMPSPVVDETNATIEAGKLTAEALSSVAVMDIEKLTLTTASNAVLAMAKIVANSSKYKIRVKDATLNENTWSGSFTLESYADEEDTADSELIDVVISDDYAQFVKQKIDSVLAKASDDATDLVALFKLEESYFSAEIKKYSLAMLTSFHDACQAALNIMIEQGVSDKETMSIDYGVYESLYEPMYTRCMLIEDEIKEREFEISTVENMQGILSNERSRIHESVDMEKYLGSDLWVELMSYRREDTFQNDNYISDGLSNSELIERALEFTDVAKKEIFKSAAAQYSISAQMKNLLIMKEFLPIVQHFEVGNWIRIAVDNSVYKLRLVEYQINYDDIANMSVVFSDVNTTVDGISDIRSILSRASSMASSYDYVARQANQGARGVKDIEDAMQDGISASDVEISDDGVRQCQMWGKNGMLFREYDSIQEKYSDEQMRIINATIAMTDDNWKTTKTAVGKFFYLDPASGTLKQVWGVNGELIAGRLLIGEALGIYNEAGTLSFDKAGFIVTNGTNTVIINPNSRQIFNINNGQKSLLSFNDDGDLDIVGNITAKSLVLSEGVKIETNKVEGLDEQILSIQTNANNIQANAEKIQVNADGIQANAEKIQTNADNIQTIQTEHEEMSSQITSILAEIEQLKQEIAALKGTSG